MVCHSLFCVVIGSRYVRARYSKYSCLICIFSIRSPIIGDIETPRIFGSQPNLNSSLWATISAPITLIGSLIPNPFVLICRGCPRALTNTRAAEEHPLRVVSCYLRRNAEYVTIQHSAENRHMTTIASFAINIVVSLICLPCPATPRRAQPVRA